MRFSHPEDESNAVVVKAALDYHARGWCVTAVSGKAPILKDWPKEFLDKEGIQQHFGHGHNVGVLLGPSGLADLDFDDPVAVKALRALAPPELKAAAEFQRAGRPSWLIN